MEFEFSLACGPPERRKVLLAGAGSDTPGDKESPKGGDKRKKASSGAGWGGKRTKIKRHAETSKSRAEVERDIREATRLNRRDNKARGADRGAKGGDRTSGRDTQELVDARGEGAAEVEIRWPGDICSGASNGSTGHHFRATRTVSAGSIFVCGKCGAVKWLPIGISEATALGFDMKKHGIQEAYGRWMDARRDARKILEKVAALEVCKPVLTDGNYLTLVHTVVETA